MVDDVQVEGAGDKVGVAVVVAWLSSSSCLRLAPWLLLVVFSFFW